MGFVKLTPASGKVSGTNSNMPLLVVPSAITNVGTLTLAEAQSVRFYSDEAKTTELAREVVSADELHVKVGSVTSTTDIWMDWDGVRSDYAATDTYGRNAVWSDYALVMHMGSTVNSTGGTGATTTGTPTNVSGKLGDATAFANTMGSSPSHYYSIAADMIPTSSGADFSFQSWYRWSASGIGILWDKQNTASSNRFFIAANYDGTGTPSNGRIGFFTNDGSATTLHQSTNPGLNNNAWHKVDFTRSSSTGAIYIAGSSVSLSGSVRPGSVHASGHNQRIATLGAANTFSYGGELDEMRVRHSVLSADWISTEYQNQNDNGAFWVATPVGAPTANNGFMLWWA